MIRRNDCPHFIGGQWCNGQGDEIVSINPANGEVIWRGNSALHGEVDLAVRAACNALSAWSNTSIEERIAKLKVFVQLLAENRESLAALISQEVGKPLWESLIEVQAMISKLDPTLDAHLKRNNEIRQENKESSTMTVTRFRPHGVVAVFGPFNFPGHISNGHILPALLAGNTVVFKPSELAPAFAQKMIELWQQAGIPKGVLNLLQGSKETGITLASHPDLDGLFFTGSKRTGFILHELFSRDPNKILALEMGGNNPLVVWDYSDIDAAVYIVIQSAFITTGQRCSCARRLIVPNNRTGHLLVERLVSVTKNISVGPYTVSPEPFIGPVISEAAAKTLLQDQDALIRQGGVPLLRMCHLQPGTGLLAPGLVDMTEAQGRQDREIFGPLLQIIRVHDFNSALDEANDTEYGLAAGLVSEDESLWIMFRNTVRAGVLNWNQQLTGSSSWAPFGGIKHSGNHRPSGYLASDYCAYGVASIESAKASLPAALPPGLPLHVTIS